MRPHLLAVAAALAVGGAFALPLMVSAHALAQSSQPADGATVPTAPSLVVITFGEVPDPQHSSISVVDTSGTSFTAGPTVPVPGHPLELEVPLKPLPNGVYTVTWRTLSSTDGHFAAAAFAFGVGVPPGAAAVAAHASVQSPPPTLFAIAARWLMFAGLLLIVGVASTSLLCLAGVPRFAPILLAAGGVVAALGTIGVVEAQREAADLTWSATFSSTLGHTLSLRLAAVAVVGLASIAAFIGQGQVRRLGLAVAAAGAAAAMWVDVDASHAVSQSPVLLNVLFQWVHILAVGVWIAGLAVLILAVRGQPSKVKARAVRRFSTMAAICLVAIAVTGVTRAAIELGAWNQVLSTDYGRLVVLKVALIVILAGLGAINRFRNVPVAARLLGGLRRIGSTEVVVGAAAVLVAAALVNVAPPVAASGSAGPPPPPLHIVATGSDYATTVRVRLEASPGTAGFNQFVLHVNDYDTGASVAADKVVLQFTQPIRPALGESTLTLARQPDGSFQARGGNLSLAGIWEVAAIIESGVRSTEVHLQVTTISVPPPVTAIRSGGLTQYTIPLSPGHSVTVYLDPNKPGANEFHVTFLDPTTPSGEITIAHATIAMTPPGGTPQLLTVRPLDPQGHLVADVNAPAGKSRFDILATTASGTEISTYIEITPGS